MLIVLYPMTWLRGIGSSFHLLFFLFVLVETSMFISTSASGFSFIAAVTVFFLLGILTKRTRSSFLGPVVYLMRKTECYEDTSFNKMCIGLS